MDLKKISIELATVSYAEQLNDFGKKMFLNTFSKIHTEDDLREYLDEDYNIEKMRSIIEDDFSCVYYAKLGNDIIGYAIGFPCILPLENILERAYELRRLYIEPKFQGSGLAIRMIKKVIGFAKLKKFKYLYIGMWKNNYRPEVWKRYSFEYVQEYPFKIGAKEDIDVILVKEIENFKLKEV